MLSHHCIQVSCIFAGHRERICRTRDLIFLTRFLGSVAFRLSGADHSNVSRRVQQRLAPHWPNIQPTPERRQKPQLIIGKALCQIEKKGLLWNQSGLVSVFISLIGLVETRQSSLGILCDTRLNQWQTIHRLWVCFNPLSAHNYLIEILTHLKLWVASSGWKLLVCVQFETKHSQLFLAHSTEPPRNDTWCVNIIIKKHYNHDWNQKGYTDSNTNLLRQWTRSVFWCM